VIDFYPKIDCMAIMRATKNIEMCF